MRLVVADAGPLDYLVLIDSIELLPNINVRPPQGRAMPSNIIDILKIVASFAGATIGGVGAFLIKEYLDRRRARQQEHQTRWQPLFIAAGHLSQSLRDWASVYKNPDYPWGDYTWTDSQNVSHPLPLAARDFHELYLIDGDPPLVRDFGNLPAAPGARRKDEQAVQRVRERIHELNAATISLYRTAVYLGYAQRVSQELQLGQLRVSRGKRQELMRLLANVRTQLNGQSGAGIIDDLQDLIGRSVWNEDGAILTYYEFRERLLSDKGWEQFIELFRFYVHFHFKIDHEVANTEKALDALCAELGGYERARRLVLATWST
jgi:hypothetical protein